jgi:Ca-activated chloride channel family protein
VRFVSPQWLWALLAVAAFYAAVVWDQRRRREQFGRFASPAVWKAIAPELDWDARLRKARALTAALAFLVLALARPQWGTHEEIVKVTGLDVMVVLDVSNSMETEDVVPSRLKKARHLIRSLLDRMSGDRVGVVAFAASSYVACPLTTDLDYVREQVEILSPQLVVNQGTDIGIGLETAARALDRGAEEAPGDAKDAQNAPASRVVILISDGEDHEEKALEGAARLKEAGVRLYVFGVGTQKGGPIPTRDDQGKLHGYKRDRLGNPVVSTFKPDALMQVAASASGRYWNVTPEEPELEELLADLGALDRSEFAERRFVIYEDRFQFPLALAVILVFLELCLPARLLMPGASALLLLSLGLSARPAAAAPKFLTEQPPVGAYMENERGVDAFKDGKIDEAKKKFGAAQALDPSRPELQFNQGVIQLKEGDVDGAIEGFAGAARGAQGRESPRLEGEALYNLGGALTQKQDYSGAIRSYLGAIDAARRAEDGALEDDARKNIELLIKKIKQQKQQQQQRSKDGKSQDQQPQSGDEKEDKGGEKEQAQRYKETPKDKRRDQFRSLKLSKEDADRVMAELSNRERDLQIKLNKQRGRPQSQQKDW